MKKSFNILKTCFALLFLAILAYGVKAEAAVNINANGLVTSDTVKGAPHVVNVISPATVQGYTLSKGIYYFDNQGKLANLNADTELPYAAAINTSASARKGVTAGKYVLSGKTYSSTISLKTGPIGTIAYQNGDKFNGIWYEGGKYYTCTGGARGALRSGVLTGTYYNAGTRTFGSLGKGVYVVNGVPTTAVINLRLYLNGIFNETYTDWYKIGNNIYYFRAGQAVTGMNYLPSYGKGVKRYNYIFRSNGVLITNLVWDYYGYQKFLSQKIKIIVNKTTHNTTFYVWDGKDYSIPALTVVCATARKKNDTPSGSYRLEKTWNKRWYVYTKTKGAPYRYYQWAVKIHGTASLFHSSTYRKKSAKSLRVDLYNKIGTSCTTHCVRHQARYAKLIYDIARYKIKVKKWRKTRIPVQIITSKNEGPFGHVGHTKVKNGTKWDPTDPNRK